MLRLLTLLAFLLTGPGLSGLEIAAHLVGDTDAEHARAPHFEAAGVWSHADHCSLGLVSHDGRLPGAPPVRRVGAALAGLDTPVPPALRFSHQEPPSRLPRAPPVTA